MSEQETVEQVVTSSSMSWLEISICRGLVTKHYHSDEAGLIFHVRADPKVEFFIKSLGNGDTIVGPGTEWVSLYEGAALSVHDMSVRVIPLNNAVLAFPGYGPVISQKSGVQGIPSIDLINLSFLRIVGIGNPDGVRFGVKGAYSRAYVKSLLAGITAETKNLINGYITPFNLSSRIYQ